METIFERVDRLRQESHLEWPDIGRALVKTKQVLYNWRTSKAIPPKEHAALAELFGCSIDYLVTGEGERKINSALPPSRMEWDALSQPVRVFISKLVRSATNGKADENDLKIMEAVLNRTETTKSQPATGDWLIGGDIVDKTQRRRAGESQ